MRQRKSHPPFVVKISGACVFDWMRSRRLSLCVPAVMVAKAEGRTCLCLITPQLCMLSSLPINLSIIFPACTVDEVGRRDPFREKQNFMTPLKLVLVARNCRDSLSAGHVQLTTPNLLKRQDALPLPPNCREPDRSRRGREAFRYRSECQAVGLLL
jgi:hypothetical protein